MPPKHGPSLLQEQNVADLKQWKAHLRYLELPPNWEEKK